LGLLTLTFFEVFLDLEGYLGEGNLNLAESTLLSIRFTFGGFSVISDSYRFVLDLDYF
jgi:hypothetical protein